MTMAFRCFQIQFSVLLMSKSFSGCFSLNLKQSKTDSYMLNAMVMAGTVATVMLKVKDRESG